MRFKSKFNAGSIAIVELTLYPHWYPGKVKSMGDTDKVRGDLALESIGEGVKNGFQMVVAEGGSSLAFQKELSKFSKITLIRRQEPSRGAGKRQGFSAAAILPGVKIILRSEPEKVSIVKNFIPQIVNPILEGKTDIVVAKRNSNFFRKSYPAYMWKSEVAGTKKYNDLLHKFSLLPKGKSLDIFRKIRAHLAILG